MLCKLRWKGKFGAHKNGQPWETSGTKADKLRYSGYAVASYDDFVLFFGGYYFNYLERGLGMQAYFYSILD